MKRIGLILLGLTVLLASLCGCSTQNKTENPQIPTEAPSKALWQPRSITVSADSIYYYKTTQNYQLAVIEQDEKFGLIDFEGNIVTPIEYAGIFLRETEPFGTSTRLECADYPDAWYFETDGTAIHIDYDAWGYTDGYDVYWYDGKPVLHREIFIEPFTKENYKEWTDPRSSLGTYETTPPKVVAVREILSVDEQSDDPFTYSDKYALLNTETQTLITDFIYEDCTRMGFYDGVAALKKGGKWGYVREDGTTVTDFIYDKIYEDPWMGCELYSVTNGYIVIRTESGYGIIDKNGNTIVEPIYENVTEVTDKGLFWFKKDSIWQVGEIL